ncbi:unnamed protein product [Lymnaea stagnalis]|uniref:Beta-lactamase-related domain-containing protein n=1 Tax=Lymnaea stagnalis TaxID=6523 RepID=A0AAV2HS38_LYMST
MGLTSLSVMCFILSLSSATSLQHHVFDRAFEHFLKENGYTGGAVAAMKDGRLLLARGYGVDRAGDKVTSSTSFPVSSLAKSLTAVAVMQLVKDGKLSLKDKVFGDLGILSDLQPWRKASVDPRLYDINVEHLLRDSAGWDDSQGPLYDAVLNRYYQNRAHRVPNIAREMGQAYPLEPKALISYMMSQPLSFEPGSRVAYSNLVYLVLGRVLEMAADMAYKEYVKRFILNPCGMWNTRLDQTQEEYQKDDTTEKSIYQAMDLSTVDSTLGWYSNVYDMIRFLRCTFETQQILDGKHLKLLLGRPDYGGDTSNDTWHGAGFRVSSKNVVWQDSDPSADDLILYHDLGPRSEGKGDPLPDSWIIMFCDSKVNHLRHQSRELMAYLEQSTPPENQFLYDLSELHRHPLHEPQDSYNIPQFTVQYKVDEHHLSAYMNALQEEGFGIQWFTSFSLRDHTQFLIVGKLISQPVRSQHQDIFEHGMDHRHLLKRKLQLEEVGYNMTQLHSYKSGSHSDTVVFAAVFRYEAFSVDKQMKYGTNHLPEPYEKLVQMYYEKQFYPISQTVVYENEDEEFSFIFVKDFGDERIDFKHYYDLTSKRLAKLTVDHGKAKLYLSYLNSYDVEGKFRFSAIYTNATTTRGVLDTDQTLDHGTEVTIANLKAGVIPKFIVPYLEDDQQLKLVIYFEEI